MYFALRRYSKYIGFLYLLQAPYAIADSDYLSAAQKLALATYKYSGYEEANKAFVKRYTPEILEKHGAGILVIVKLLSEKQITYVWRFP